ncbi:DUF1674 domain-containing protein [Arenimonas sp.]|uniref:DUF1674 domain-containing protein n=1 Tax=Arenimonas sp. TaxID=1872635 RepID=UPI0035B2B48C
MSTESRIIGDSAAPPETPAGERDGAEADKTPPVEIGGRDGPDPTRYGDWEKGGRCIDF